MYLDPAAGLYVFEVVLGFRSNGKTQYSHPCLIQADDSEEAEEKIMECLCNMGWDRDFWIDRMSNPHSIQTYRERLREELTESLPLLEELNEEEWRDFLRFSY